jgi:septal ring factor EnvC (AmiA/AmiB activator)
MVAQQIDLENRYLNNINKQIEILSKRILELKRSLATNKNSMNKLVERRDFLLSKKVKLEQDVIDFISKNYYVKSANTISEKDVIREEIIKIVTKQSARKMEGIYKVYEKIDEEIMKIDKLIASIKDAKHILQLRWQEMSQLKAQKQENLKNLNDMKLVYKKELDKIIKSQQQLENQLSKLNIIKKQELAKQREQQAKELKNKLLQQQKSKKLANIDKTKIKNYGNIYMRTKTIRYRGRKTISPLKGKIVKNFGAYLDPVYNISLYNDSITIKSFKKDEKVKAILPGKVVFVGDTNEGKMVVIKHRNRLHSIYAKLSRLSPFVKKGYKVKKGEVIAKINNELEFEITYKTLPINPREVVNFK